MGKQFQVYLLPTDAIELVTHLKRKVDLCLLMRRSDGPQPVETDSPVKTEGSFSRADCLLVPNIPNQVKLDYIETQRYWRVNTLFSEVIEFYGCHFDGKTLKRGRFFFDTGFYKSGEWHEKPTAFLKWADGLFRNAKRLLKRIPSLDAYVGTDAELWHSKGGVFVELSIKGRPPVVAQWEHSSR